jgi:hypothetical protein
MKELDIAMDFQSQDDNHRWHHLASDSINHLQKFQHTPHVKAK